MTLLGKIFTVLILIMAVAFMMLASMIFATHRNWRVEVLRPRDDPKGPGLKVQVQDLKKLKGQLDEELNRAHDDLAREQAARLYALAGLQTKLEQASLQVVQLAKQVADKEAENGSLTTTLLSNQSRLDAMDKETNQLRASLRDAQQARDAKFDQVVQLMDKVAELEGVKKSLQEYEKQLLTQVARQKRVLESRNLDEFTPVDEVPPRVDGIVTAVGEKDLIEISLGSDDGLRAGHTLDVFRNNSYLGRVKIVRTEPDKAVAEILGAYRKGIIRKGDRVATKLT
jgi:hypothetical protein